MRRNLVWIRWEMNQKDIAEKRRGSVAICLAVDDTRLEPSIYLNSLCSPSPASLFRTDSTISSTKLIKYRTKYYSTHAHPHILDNNTSRKLSSPRIRKVLLIKLLTILFIIQQKSTLNYFHDFTYILYNKMSWSSWYQWINTELLQSN